MTQFLPPNLLALFAPRDPIPYLPPADKLPHEKRLPVYGGVAQCLYLFEVSMLTHFNGQIVVRITLLRLLYAIVIKGIEWSETALFSLFCNLLQSHLRFRQW